MPDLFEANARAYYREHAPLASRMRPESLEGFFGQEALVGEGRFLRRMVDSDALKSLILWGPPGTGKTTLARIIARKSGRRFVSVSAVTSGVAEIKKIIAEAARALTLEQKGTILFIDEIHRFNKAQQDALLGGVEEGTLTLIGATTENPSFEVNGALLSRAQVLVLEPLDGDALRSILRRALGDGERGLGKSAVAVEEEAEQALIGLAGGDARTLLNFLELSVLLARSKQAATVTAETVREATGRRSILYDKSGEEHYNVISALIKSMRASDPDAALYYLARMIEGGEDPLFLARRMVIFASEDVGNADPQALHVAVACKEAVAFVGMPEGYYPLSQCALYLARAPKSRAAGEAYQRALRAVREHGALPVPMHLRNAPTKLMEELGYGSKEGQGSNLPQEIRDARFTDPD